jgi:tRNA(fMet)-specific endonuclease VapC
LDWPHEASGLYAEIRDELDGQGTPIGSNDLLIAAHALYLDCTLVTNSLDEFRRVRRLICDNWV